MVFGKVWAMIAGTEAEAQTSPPPQTKEMTPPLHAHATPSSRLVNRAKDAKMPPPPPPPPVIKLAKKKRAKIPPLSGSQWGSLLEHCYTLVQADPENNSIRAFCQEWCPQHERRFYDAWKEAGLQALMEQGFPVADPRVQKGIDLVVAKKTDVYVKKRKLTTTAAAQRPPPPPPPPRQDLPKKPPKKKPRIDRKRYGPRGPYQRLLTGREWADYLENCYEYLLTATGKPTILAFCDEHCPSRKRTFYTVWKKSGLQEYLADRLPLQDVRVQARLQNFIETYDNNKYLNDKKKRAKKTSNRNARSSGAKAPSDTAAVAAAVTTEAAAAAAAATTISNWMRRNAAAIVDATPVGIAVPVQTEHGDMLSAIKINSEDFILYEDNRLLKISKDDLLDDYRILGGGGGAMHHPALTGGTAHVLNSPLFLQGTSVTYGDAKYLQANDREYPY